MVGLNECNLWRPQEEGGRLEQLYNSVHRKFNQLEIRCGRKDQHPARGGGAQAPIEQLEIRRVEEMMLEWGTRPTEAGSLGPRLNSTGEEERNAIMARRVGVNMLQFCSVSSSLSHTNLSIKSVVYFSKELCRSSLLCRHYYSACICVCIVVHGYTTKRDKDHLFEHI